MFENNASSGGMIINDLESIESIMIPYLRLCMLEGWDSFCPSRIVSGRFAPQIWRVHGTGDAFSLNRNTGKVNATGAPMSL